MRTNFDRHEVLDPAARESISIAAFKRTHRPEQLLSCQNGQSVEYAPGHHAYRITPEDLYRAAEDDNYKAQLFDVLGGPQLTDDAINTSPRMVVTRDKKGLLRSWLVQAKESGDRQITFLHKVEGTYGAVMGDYHDQQRSRSEKAGLIITATRNDGKPGQPKAHNLVIEGEALKDNQRTGFWVLFPKTDSAPAREAEARHDGCRTYQAGQWEGRRSRKEDGPHMVKGKTGFAYTKPADQRSLSAGLERPPYSEDRVEIVEGQGRRLGRSRTTSIDVALADGATDEGDTGWRVATAAVDGYISGRQRNRSVGDAMRSARSKVMSVREEAAASASQTEGFRPKGAASVTFFHAERTWGGRQWKVEGGYRGSNRCRVLFPDGNIHSLTPDANVFTRTPLGAELGFTSSVYNRSVSNKADTIKPLRNGPVPVGSIVFLYSNGLEDAMTGWRMKYIGRAVKSGADPQEIAESVMGDSDPRSDRTLVVLHLK